MRWREGVVECSGGCLGVQFGLPAGSPDRDWIPVALVGPPVTGVVNVEFLVDRGRSVFASAVKSVEKEIQYYLIDKGEADARGYMTGHHVGQLANEYGPVQWGWFPTALDAEAYRFRAHLRTFSGVRTKVLGVAELRKNPDWDWGYGRGVYCFVDDAGVVAYVGRSLGKTLGERVWEHLRDRDDGWLAATNGPGARVVILELDDDSAYVGSALEAFLIARLEPKINKRRQ
jgi:hypothetical protein